MTSEGTEIDGASLLDPAYLAVLGELPSFALTVGGLPTLRAAPMVAPFERSGAVTSTDHAVPGTEVVVRAYRPVGLDGPLPCLYAIHGGGYVLGSYDMLDERFERWCPEFGCVGVSVKYRLAPEAPYPAALDDCYAGLAWVHEHHAELGVDPGRIGIGGVSAGGGLTAALALLVRDRGELSVAFQLLECPMLDDRRHTPSSRIDGLAVWSRESNEFGWRSYLGELFGRADVPYTAAPSRATDLSGLPPTLMCVGGADGFRDEDVEYALRLAQAGVSTELHVYPGAPHGASLVPTATAAMQWERDVEDWMARQFADDGP